MNAPGPAKNASTRFVQAAVLALLFALLFVATRAVPETYRGISSIAALGFLLLAGTLMSELAETIAVPHLTGYLIAGIVAGPHALALVDHGTVESLTPINALALALIAFAGGAELKLETLRRGLRGLAWGTLIQSVAVLAAMSLIFAGARSFIPFVRDMPVAAVVGVSLLWGVMSVTRSPSATLAILAQTRAAGPLTTATLAMVMTSDIVVVVLLATVTTLARPLVEPGATLSLAAFHSLGHELLGSVALGTTLGLGLAAYLRFFGKNLLVVFVALGFGFTEVIRYLRFEPLLTFMVAGFLVQNLSSQGEKFLHAVEETSSIVFVVFFAIAGAELDVPLLRELWPVALFLCAARMVLTVGAARVASWLADDPPTVKRWGWSGLVSQAGLALGLAAMVARTFPSFGAGFRALAIATVAVNEIVGPVLFKLALDRTGESSPAPERTTRDALAAERADGH